MPTNSAPSSPATARASFGPYTTEADVRALGKGLEKVRELFR